MRFGRAMRWTLVLATLLALSGCGGGGSGGAQASAATSTHSGTTASADGWTPGVYASASVYAARCAAPRTGTDPYTGKPYPDVPGTVTDQNNWLRSWTHALYYWYSEVPDLDPSLYSTSQYFDLMKTTQTDANGAPKDRFHFSYPTATWEAMEEGSSVGYGVQWAVVNASPPRKILVAYTQPGTPAADAPADLVRGAELLDVDGVDVINGTTTTDIDTINAALAPATDGETHSFTVLDPGSSTPRTFTMQAQNITDQPVLLVKTLATAAGTVGYILYNDQVDVSAEAELIQAIDTLKSDGVTNLILDLRYNGGGLLDLASELAYMVAGPTQTAGETFYVQQFNDQHPTTNPVTGTPITPLPFLDTTQGFSVKAGQALPTLDLSRVFVLTGADTCSASEAIINGLRGVGIEVYQFGSTTCGKPYGFYPQDNCGTTYFSIEFKGVNAKGFGDFGDGFSPENTASAPGVKLPGCSVADDFSHALGNPNEAVLSAALAYMADPSGTVCPAATGGGSPALQAKEQRPTRIRVRSPLRQMLILPKPRRGLPP
ncbi:MAG: S41 family peptidase [Steroidobacteraceae bacterium]